MNEQQAGEPGRAPVPTVLEEYRAGGREVSETEYWQWGPSQAGDTMPSGADGDPATVAADFRAWLRLVDAKLFDLTLHKVEDLPEDRSLPWFRWFHQGGAPEDVARFATRRLVLILETRTAAASADGTEPGAVRRVGAIVGGQRPSIEALVANRESGGTSWGRLDVLPWGHYGSRFRLTVYPPGMSRGRGAWMMTLTEIRDLVLERDARLMGIAALGGVVVLVALNMLGVFGPGFNPLYLLVGFVGLISLSNSLARFFTRDFRARIRQVEALDMYSRSLLCQDGGVDVDRVYSGEWPAMRELLDAANTIETAEEAYLWECHYRGGRKGAAAHAATLPPGAPNPVAEYLDAWQTVYDSLPTGTNGALR